MRTSTARTCADGVHHLTPPGMSDVWLPTLLAGDDPLQKGEDLLMQVHLRKLRMTCTS